MFVFVEPTTMSRKRYSFFTVNCLKGSTKCMYSLLQYLVTLHFVDTVYSWVSYDSQNRAIISINSKHQLRFVMDMRCVCFEVRKMFKCYLDQLRPSKSWGYSTNQQNPYSQIIISKQHNFPWLINQFSCFMGPENILFFKRVRHWAITSAISVHSTSYIISQKYILILFSHLRWYVITRTGM
jgi:hypothetical protein